MAESEEEEQTPSAAPAQQQQQPPLRGFAAQMADYAAKRAALGHAPPRPPEMRVLLLVSSEDGIVATAERLQELAELPEPPAVIEVPFAEPRGALRRLGPTPADALGTIRISDITLSALVTLEEKAHTARYGGSQCVWYRGRWSPIDVVVGAKRVLIS